MKQVLRYLTYIFFAVCSLSSYGQESALKKANEKFEDYAYIDARDLYLKVADKGFKSAEVLSKLGDSYYFTADYTDAVKWYEQLINYSQEEIAPEYYFRYGQSLKSIGRYDQSDEAMTVFDQLRGEDSRAKMFKNERDYIKEIEAQSGRYSVESVNFNTELQDFGPSFYGDRVVFSSNRENSTGDYLHDWNDQPFLDLYIASDPKGASLEVRKFDSKMNTPYHESTSVFTENGDEIYFTRNNYTSKKLRRSDDGTAKLKLYHSVKRSGKWSVPKELSFSSDQYSIAHPALSPDGQTLYFASDMPGTKGLSDIWKVAILGDGSYGEVVNLGDKINTEARETFPFVTSDNKLFFATDGHVGLGGLDIFIAKLDENGVKTAAYNVGKPVNSTSDDFGLILSEQLGTGYFASNRGTGIGNDDIYSFKRLEKLITNCIQNITGVTRDVKTDKILPEATVELRNVKNEVVSSYTSDDAGRFSFPDVECGKTYVIRAQKENYEPAEVILTTSTDVGGAIARDLYLKPDAQLIVGQDLGKILDLNPIYFDFDKSNIRPDAALELQKVIAVMTQYPTLKIDVRSHTDSRAADGYNMTLSQRRNVSTIAYIVNQGGINESRLTGRGYGETQLINACANTIECSEEAHQLNRRSEFIIVSK